MHGSSLEEIITEQFYEQEKNNKLMISILSHIVEFRNGESGRHVLHVNTITKYLLKQLVRRTDKYHLSKPDINLITIASSLHDIGKIAIPDAILNKPGRLTAEEFEVIKTHSVIGANMLLDLSIEQRENPLIKVASEICRWHHERYDGNGYPDGLKGEEIPIAAQVVALADVYDALTSERCYKKAYSHEEALKMILEGQCGAFNPTLLLCLQEIADTLESELMDTSSEQETKSIQDVRDIIDYDRLFLNEKRTCPSRGQQRPQLLYIDSLTNVYNRRYYDEFFQGADDMQAMAVIDVDDFKHINDNYGHDVGDIILQSIAQTVLSCVRKTDAVIRYGGDEFVIIFFSMPQEIFEKKLERIRHSVDSLIIDGHPELHMSVSIGGAYGIGTAKKLFKVADDMMYQSKNTKNKVTICFLNEKSGSKDNI